MGGGGKVTSHFPRRAAGARRGRSFGPRERQIHDATCYALGVFVLEQSTSTRNARDSHDGRTTIRDHQIHGVELHRARP